MDKLSDYDFEFDEERIALRPQTPRGDARLLHFDGAISDYHVRDYPDLLSPDDLLIFNDTKVLPARLDGERVRQTAEGEVRAKISVTLLDPADHCAAWRALIKPLKKVEIGEEIEFAPNFKARLTQKSEGQAVLQFDDHFADQIAHYGRMPLPPYIEGRRRADAQDRSDYQPYLAEYEGAVAAPTASLHFDETLMNALDARSILFETLTLHVGAGTFLPVKNEHLDDHKMHSERGIISTSTAAHINDHKARGGRVIAVGTTALRLLETAARNGELAPFDGKTDIFIRPGFEFQIADGLITNFHLPQSTLLMLVAAFVGYENMRAIYDHALSHEYRFFSYGDSSLLWRA